WTRIDCNTFQHETLRQLYYNLPGGTVKEYVPEGRVSSGGRITVSADGKTLTNKHTGTLGNQTRYEDEILVFDRQKAATSSVARGRVSATPADARRRRGMPPFSD